MREVRYELSASGSLDAAAAEFPRVHDAMNGLEWRLRHKPEDAVSRDKYYVYRQEGFAQLNIPDIVVLYRYEGEIVNIVALHIEKAGGK
jgi:hypothetical protein